MLRFFDSSFCRHVALNQDRQKRAVFIVFVVNAFFVQRQKAREFDNLTSRTQSHLACTVKHIDGRALHTRRSHLAGQRAFVDQVV